MALEKPENFESSSGIGVRGQVAGRQLALGNTTLMEQLGVSVAAMVRAAPPATIRLKWPLAAPTESGKR